MALESLQCLWLCRTGMAQMKIAACKPVDPPAFGLLAEQQHITWVTNT